MLLFFANMADTREIRELLAMIIPEARDQLRNLVADLERLCRAGATTDNGDVADAYVAVAERLVRVLSGGSQGSR